MSPRLVNCAEQLFNLMVVSALEAGTMDPQEAMTWPEANDAVKRLMINGAYLVLTEWGVDVEGVPA